MKLFQKKNIIQLKESEFSLPLGELIGKGAYKRVFNHKTDKNKVIKIGVGILNEVKAFKEHPKSTPKVYSSGVLNDGVEWSEIEKVDVPKAKNDFELYIDKDRGYVHDWGLKIFKNDSKFNLVKNSLTTEKGKNMLEEVRKLVLDTNLNDVHGENFGYTTKGELKIVDL